MPGHRTRLPALAGCALVLSAAPVAGAETRMAAGTGPAPRAEVQAPAPLPRGVVLGRMLAPATRLHVIVTLRAHDGLSAYAAAVSNPRSPLYRHFLTVAGFKARFGAGAADVATVRSTLRRAGLAPGALSANGLSISVSATAAGVQRAFDTRLDRVALPHGRTAFADVATPTLPSRVASLVQGVVGLDSLPLVRPEGLVRARSRARLSAQAQSSGAGPSTCAAAQASGNTAQDIASAYGLQSEWQAGDIGSGATVALYELEPFSASDIAAYKSCYGIATTVNVTQVDHGAGSGAGSGEAALDIEDVAGLAPGATIDVYEGPNDGYGPYAVLSRMVTDDSAQVISTSWGECESQTGAAYAADENTLLQEAAAQGQSVFAAAGDSGADDCGDGSAAVDDPASQPDVTGVGGTSLTSYLAPADESVWNDGPGGGAAGGGESQLWSAPSYQASLGASMREVPDVSADADPETGYAVDYDNRWQEVGGTSAAAPTWAALTALALRSSACAAHTHGLGLLDDALYTLPESDFDDITSGNNTYDGVTGFSAATGYDMASGLGAPRASALVPALCAAGAGAAVDQTVTTPTTPTPTTTTTSAPPTTTTTTTTTGAPPTSTSAQTTSTPATPPSTGTTSTGTARHPRPATVVFSVPGRRRSRLLAVVHVRLHASDRSGRRLSYSVVGLPPGLHLDRRTGEVTGRPRRAGRYVVSVAATDAAGNASSVVIHWTITGRGDE